MTEPKDLAQREFELERDLIDKTGRLFGQTAWNVLTDWYGSTLILYLKCLK